MTTDLLPEDDSNESSWRVPAEFGIERARNLEQGEVELADMALLVTMHYYKLIENGIPEQLAAVLTRDFSAQANLHFWNG